MRVGAGQPTQPAHQLVSLGQVVVKSQTPVSTVLSPHQAEVLLDTTEIFPLFMFVRRFIPVEREDCNLPVCSSLESLPETGGIEELNRIVWIFPNICSTAVSVRQWSIFRFTVRKILKKNFTV